MNKAGVRLIGTIIALVIVSLVQLGLLSLRGRILGIIWKLL